MCQGSFPDLPDTLHLAQTLLKFCPCLRARWLPLGNMTTSLGRRICLFLLFFLGTKEIFPQIASADFPPFTRQNWIRCLFLEDSCDWSKQNPPMETIPWIALRRERDNWAKSHQEGGKKEGQILSKQPTESAKETLAFTESECITTCFFLSRQHYSQFTLQSFLSDFYVKHHFSLTLCCNLVSFFLQRDHNGNPTIKTLECHQRIRPYKVLGTFLF